jgi:hypothetical protein
MNLTHVACPSERDRWSGWSTVRSADPKCGNVLPVAHSFRAARLLSSHALPLSNGRAVLVKSCCSLRILRILLPRGAPARGRPRRRGPSVWICPAIYLAAAAIFKGCRVEACGRFDSGRHRAHRRRVQRARTRSKTARGLHALFIGMTRDFIRLQRLTMPAENLTARRIYLRKWGGSARVRFRLPVIRSQVWRLPHVAALERVPFGEPSPRRTRALAKSPSQEPPTHA